MPVSSKEDRVITLSSDALSVSVLANRGARLTSLFNRNDQREWLSQPRHRTFERGPEYGSLFTETDHYGWDEMCPTVDACRFPGDPFLGEEVPDHGELWTLAWDVIESSDTRIHQRVKSERFGFTFERDLRVEGAALRSEYTCVVASEVAVPLLWALHPQFTMKDGSRLVLPGLRSTVFDTSLSAEVRDATWLGDAVVERDVAKGEDRMFYLRPEDHANEAALIDETGSWLKLAWDRTFAPYLGIWMDHAHYTPGRVMAIEPTNGFFDDLSRAHQQGTLVPFQPGERVSWWVELTIGSGEVKWRSS